MPVGKLKEKKYIKYFFFITSFLFFSLDYVSGTGSWSDPDRIRIGSGSVSWAYSFRQWVSRCQQKSIFLLTVGKTFTTVFDKLWKSHITIENNILHVDERIWMRSRIRTEIITDSDSCGPKTGSGTLIRKIHALGGEHRLQSLVGSAISSMRFILASWSSSWYDKRNLTQSAGEDHSFLTAMATLHQIKRTVSSGG